MGTDPGTCALLECERRGQKPLRSGGSSLAIGVAGGAGDSADDAASLRNAPPPTWPPDELVLCSTLPTEELHRGHAVTALTVAEGRDCQELVVGDSAGLVSRWAAARLDHVDTDDATSLLLLG